ncbi:hypothetical protein [Nocardioides sp. T2.26MG-1]|uniref:hypothetical protein n=1 Tax=Nocardioides sp. T2.26MG-1 TaxID=3041166 RepID=UPI0024774CB2|nr:hypothetical protein [Nocardioides sp. T2.26MG-1]CAI9419610.1 hypothetical protein HIDPHFAB_03779 [Nocardioides sp. T2.26MG-1]
MSTEPTPGRLAYDDPATPAEMSRDCEAVRAALRPAPSIHYADFPREVPKRGEIEISAAAARIAGALNLQLDGDA